MLSKIIKPFLINKTLLKISSFKFSVNPAPNPKPQNNENQPQIQPQNIDTPKQQPSEPQNSITRKQARIRVSRAQLAKFAKAELDYEKLNSPTRQLQTVTKYLKKNGFKIITHTEPATRLQFYRPQETAKKSDSKQKQSKEEKQQEFVEQEEEEEQEEDIKLQMKIFTNPTRQISNSIESSYLDEFFTRQEEGQKGNTNGLPLQINIVIGKKGQGPRGGFVNFDSKNINQKTVTDFVNRINRSPFNTDTQATPVNETLTMQDRFKEFTVYIRNKNTKPQFPNAPQKWAKIELMVEQWMSIHMYKISMVSSIENELKTVPQKASQFQGVQVKQLDPQVISLIQASLSEAQQLWPEVLSAVYYYTGLCEHQQYKKWLEDLVDICK